MLNFNYFSTFFYVFLTTIRKYLRIINVGRMMRLDLWRIKKLLNKCILAA